MTTFEQYLEEAKHRSELQTETFSWYLSQIRKLVQSDEPVSEEEHREKTSGGETSEEGKIAQDARKFVIDENVLETDSQFGLSMIGKMIFFRYDAKTKEQLPYWDMFPLVFFLRVYHGASLAINLHYLPFYERARLMTILYSLSNSEDMNPNMKLLVTYKTLNESARFAYFKPCVKKYLHDHLRSRVMIINPQKWNQTLLLPLAKFQKSNELKVWQDSINQITAQRIKKKK